MDNTAILASLDDAYRILSRACTQLSSLASNTPYLRVANARKYITEQANELLDPIFEKQ